MANGQKGALEGTAIGGGIGALFGGVGAVPGAAIGGTVGGLVSNLLGKKKKPAPVVPLWKRPAFRIFLGGLVVAGVVALALKGKR